MGHTVVLAKAKGASNALEEGVKKEKGSLEIVQRGVIEASNHTIIYPDPQLLLKLKQKYPDIESRKDVGIIKEAELDAWYDAVRQITVEKGFKLPD